MDRLQKVIANYGYCSRRAAEQLIVDCKVFVNGEMVNTLGTKVSLHDEIEVEGKVLNKQAKIYYALNKPIGFISSASDDKGRHTVTELVPNKVRVYPIGRLDYNTTGILLLTNDGELTNKLTHPKGIIEKVYQVRVNGTVTKQALRKLRTGVDIDGYTTKPAKAINISVDSKNDSTLLEITITEGKNRQIRRMCEALGYEVKKLKRVKFANISTTDIALGCYRELKPYELKVLKDMVK